MRKVLHKVKSQWVVLGVMGATVVSLGTMDVQRVSAAEVDGVTVTDSAEQSGNLAGTDDPITFSTEETTTEEIPYATVEVADGNLEEGKTEVRQAGVNGTQSNTYSVTYADGIETSRTLLSSVVTTVPTDEVIAVGTKDVTAPVIDVASLSVSEVAVAEGETITVSVGITDASGISSASVTYLSPVTGQTRNVDLYRNESSGLFEGSIIVANDTELGTWKASSVTAYDTSGNSALLSNSSIELSLLNFTVMGTTADDSDITKPAIDVSSIKVSQTSAVSGETITVSANLTDDVGVTRGRAYYESPTGIWTSVYLYKNEINGLYEGTITVDNSTQSGNWNLAAIYADDAAGNETHYSRYDVDLSAANFTVTGTDADVSNPVIDASSVKVSQTSAFSGETITVSANLTDDVGVTRGRAYYESPTGIWTSVYLYKNEINGLYEGTITVDNSTQSGNWNLAAIYADDAAGNETHYSRYDVDLSAANFTVTGTEADVSNPVIDASSVKVSQTSAVSGETITVSANLTDDVGVIRGRAYYESPTGIWTSVYLYKNEINGLYEGTIIVDNSTQSGNWNLAAIYADDAADNETHYSRYDVDLSAANFVVCILTTEISETTAQIPYETVTVEDATLLIGETKVAQSGVDGTSQQTYAVTLIDGVETKRELIKTTTITAPINKIIKVGPQPVESDNAAIGATLTTSVNFDRTHYIADGQIATKNNYANGAPGLQWVQMDLGTGYELNAVQLWHYYADGRSYRDVVVQLSNDETFTNGVVTVFNNDEDGSASLGVGTDSEYSETGEGKTIGFATTNARYARFYSNGSNVNGWNHYIEIKLYGTEVPEPQIEPLPESNVARDATLTTSANFDRTYYITDDQTATKNNYANGAPGLQWVQMDLGSDYDLNAVQLWHYYADGRSYRDVIVQLSNDETFTNGVVTVFNNDKDGSAGLGVGTDSEYSETSEGKAFGFATTNARYARFYSNGSNVNGWNHYIEIKVYGAEAEEPPVTTNVANGATLTTSANFDRTHYIADGQTTTTNNYANGTPGLQWVQMDLGAAYDLNAVQLWHYYADGRTYRDVIVQLSNDETFSEAVVTVFNNDKDGSVGFGVGNNSEYSETSAGKAITFDTTNARYIRFYSNGSNMNGWNHYVEIKVSGVESQIEPPIDVVTENQTNLTDYNITVGAVQEENYTEASWATYQEVVSGNTVTLENTQAEVDSATAVILDAQSKLEVSVKNIIVTADNQVEGSVKINVTNFDAEKNIMISKEKLLENPALVKQGETLQLAATISPENAVNQTVTWSVDYLTTTATIDDTGLLTTSGNSTGVVTVKAIATDGSDAVGSKEVIIARPISIRGYAGTDTELVIPKVIAGYSVKTYTFAYDSYSYKDGFQITKLGYTEIGMITSIRDYAFIEETFTSVVIPDTVNHIGIYAFRNSKLASLKIPDSVTSIGDRAFYGSQQLSMIMIGKNVSVGSYMLTGNNNNFRDAYLAGGGGTYNKTLDGEWIKISE